MKWQTVASILAVLLVGIGLVTYTDLFGALFQLTGVSSTHSGDIYCKEDCVSYINVTTTYWRICFAHYKGTKYADDGVLFKKQSRSRTLHVNLDNITSLISTEPKVPVDWLVPARGRGNWRPIKDGDCWDRRKINRIKLVGHKEEWQDVKWSFEVGDYVEIDPIWSSGIEIGGKVVKELCEIKYESGIDEIQHDKICTNCYNITNINSSGKFLNESSGEYYDTIEKCYNYTCIDIEYIPYINRQIGCDKTGDVEVDDKLYSYENADCKIVDNRYLVCIKDSEAGVWNEFREDCSVDGFKKDLITGEITRCPDSIESELVISVEN